MADRQKISRQIEHANATLAWAEQVKKYAIVDGPWTVGVELTPTQIVRRCMDAQTCADIVEALCVDTRAPS